MSSPIAHSPPLPGNRPAKERLSCGTCDKTFVNMRTRHTHLMRYKHELTEIADVHVPFYLHLRRQSIKCPLCSFKSKKVKSPRSFITHFSCHQTNYTLQMVYTCAVCTDVMTSDEVQPHLEMHRSNRLALTPIPELSFHQASPDSTPSVSSTVDDACSTSSSPPSSQALSTSPPNPPESLDIQTLPDSQNPMSPMAPSPPCYSPTGEVNAALMQRFIDACGNTPTQPMPTSPVSPSTPSPAVPPLMANIINTPRPDIPQTRQPSTYIIPPLMANPITTPNNVNPPMRPIPAPVCPRPRAADFFDLPPPSMVDLPEPDEATTPPPRPQSLPSTTSPTQTLSPPAPSPIVEDPSTVSFPTTQTSESLQDFRFRYKLEFEEDMEFHVFEGLTNQFTTEAVDLARTLSSQQRPRPAPRRSDRPSARPPIDRRRPLSADPSAAKRLQHLYRISKKRAARKIFGDESPGYDGTIDEATQYFTQTFGPRPCDTTHLLEELSSFVPTAATDDSLFSPPSPEELSAKLRSMSNSAPGKDRLEYRHLRLLDPRCEILAEMFRHCFLAKDVPSAWKTATTILIHKKEDTSDASNFRPIALMSCLYKLLMAILARRMTSFSLHNDLLSPEQKSARPSEGCYEHAFLLESIVNDARRQPRPLCVAWLDVRNAFGSIPHPALLTTLTHMGFPPALVEMIGQIYTGATTEVVTPLGKTPSIPIYSGVKQGCPLSAILFNLSVELIIRKCNARAESLPRGPLKHHGSSISILAYADDIVILARNKESLQSILDAVSSAADSLNLHFRPDKCASLSLAKHAPRIQPNEFQVQGEPILALEREDHYRYLGVPIGLIPNITDLQKLLDDLTTKLEKIEHSLLAPWQKLDAIRTFVQPCLTYALRSTDPTTKSLQSYRSQLLKTVRTVCHLPTRASTHYVFASKQAGGLGLTDPTRENHLQTIVQAIKMLASLDPTVSSIAKAELRQTVRFATQSDPTPSLISKFLSNLPDRRLDSIRSRTGSLWTRTRNATKTIKVTVNVPDIGSPTITTPEYADEVAAKDVCRFLHNLERDISAKSLRELRDQGKVSRALSNDKFGNGSHWHYTGLNLRFKDWRFVHRARLNCLPINAVKQRWSETSPSCRHCEQDETLPHVLCHCPTNMPAITTRHNKIVDRITNAVRYGSISTDQTVRDSGSAVRPDIVIEHNNQVIIIDVCCPFENGAEALDEAVARKELKYLHLKTHFESQEKTCDVFGFAVGALGTWHPDNERVLSALGMSPRYKNLFRKLCCTDVIQGSTDIYRQHLGCDDVLP